MNRLWLHAIQQLAKTKYLSRFQEQNSVLVIDFTFRRRRITWFVKSRFSGALPRSGTENASETPLKSDQAKAPVMYMGSQTTFCFHFYSTLSFPVWGHGICSPGQQQDLVVREQIRVVCVLPVITIDFSVIRTHDSPCTNQYSYY